MANIKKSFNFRNGVQVDDDNLKVSATGLVGIGTTVPTEALDVRGNFVVSGVSSAVNAQAGVMTVTTLNPTEIIGAGVSIVSGIVTASSGIITFYGDARFLQGMPTSQWEDTNTGLGVSSIYNTGGNVGIATSNPQSTIQVGENPDIVGGKGVGISSVGNINASGIVSATTFKGNVTGDLTGNVTGDTVVSGVSTFNNMVDINAQTNLQNAVVTGFVTFYPTGGTKFFTTVDAQGDLDVDGHTNLDNVSISGIATVIDLDVDGHTNLDNVSIAGMSTFSDDIFTGVGATVGIGTSVFFDSNAGLIWGDDDFDIFHDTQNSYVDSRKGALNLRTLGAGAIPTGTGTNVQIISDDEYMARFMRNSSVDLYYDNGLKFQTSGIGATVYNQLDTTNIVASGVVTATTELNSPLIGVGTDAPANDIQVRKSGNAEIQVTSDGGVAGLTVGRESGTGDTNNAEFRYGGGSGTPYSSAQSLDILNYGTGNFNYHLSANNAGAVAGDFHWHKGKNNTRLMTLTGIGGSLGIGITTPTQALHVAGNGFIAGNLTVDDTLTATSLNVSTTVNFSNIICGTVAGTLIGNTNSTSGISTFNRLKTTSSTSNFAGIGIKTDNTSSLPFDLYGNGSSSDTRVFITANGRIGIQTSTIDNGVDISAVTSRATISSVGIGTTNPQSAVDMRFAGKELTGIFANRMYMLPPQVNTAQRAALQGVVSGAVIYYTDQDKLQVYVGTGAYNVFNWQNLN